MMIRGAVGFTVQSSDGSKAYWFAHLPSAEKFFDGLIESRQLDALGNEVQRPCYNLIAWDKHPSQEDSVGIILKQHMRGDD